MAHGVDNFNTISELKVKFHIDSTTILRMKESLNSKLVYVKYGISFR